MPSLPRRRPPQWQTSARRERSSHYTRSFSTGGRTLKTARCSNEHSSSNLIRCSRCSDCDPSLRSITSSIKGRSRGMHTDQPADCVNCGDCLIYVSRSSPPLSKTKPAICRACHFHRASPRPHGHLGARGSALREIHAQISRLARGKSDNRPHARLKHGQCGTGVLTGKRQWRAHTRTAGSGTQATPSELVNFWPFQTLKSDTSTTPSAVKSPLHQATSENLFEFQMLKSDVHHAIQVRIHYKGYANPDWPLRPLRARHSNRPCQPDRPRSGQSPRCDCRPRCRPRASTSRQSYSPSSSLRR